MIGSYLRCVATASLVVVAATPLARGESGAARYVRYSFTVENTRNVSATGIVLYVQLPVCQAVRQRTLDFKVVPEAEVLRDGAGNQVACVVLPFLPPLGSRLVEIEARLDHAAQDPGLQSGDEPRDYLRPEEWIESEAPEIKKQAAEAPAGDARETARWFFDFIRAKIRVKDIDPADRGALWALQHEQGDCTELAYLFVALCRARGIPARVLGGYRCDGNCVLAAAGYHNWAEFHDGRAWVIVDLALGDWDVQEPRYVLMKVHTPAPDERTGFFHRARLVAPEGVEARMNGLR
ncbi:MAG: transglutaminase domain-containing protein [Kiritimatiellae bacterium]|nr:transglutaminase domain-containing protein [Kiritimatiellia bacterium]